MSAHFSGNAHLSNGAGPAAAEEEVMAKTLRNDIAAPEQTASARLRVLIVEDYVDGAQTTAKLMQLYGYDVRVAFNGPAALCEVQNDGPDVVLLDIGLPGISGYEVARQMRDQSRGKCPFFIAITGFG